jgi:cell division protein ZapA (FtsZ GTPase activity inhibitor)
MEKRQLKIEILGASFVVQSEESLEHLTRVGEYLRSKVEEAKSRYSFADPLTVALLAGLNVTDELFRARQAGAQGLPDSEIESVAKRLIETMDDELLSHTPYEGDNGGSQGWKESSRAR